MRPFSPWLTRRQALQGLAATTVLTSTQALAAPGQLVVAVHGLPDSLQMGGSSFADENIAYQVMDPLVLRNDRGDLQPGLALSWTATAPDIWQFKLRPNVTFHDGSRFTATDVKSTLDFVLAPASLYGLRSRVSQIDHVEIADDLTVLIHTKGPFPTLAAGLGDIAIESASYTARVGRDGMLKHPVGTGPFQFKSWVPGDTYELTAFDAHWGGTPRVRSLLLRNVPEATTRVASLLAGEAHIAEEIPIDLLPELQASKVAEIASIESTVGLLLTFDTRKPPFNDPRVRLALNLAVDRQKLLDQLLGGQGSILQGQILTSNTFGFDPALKAHPFDPARARALLAEAGYPNGFSTSLTTRSGKYLSDVDIANVCAAMFADVGVQTQVNVVEEGVFSKMVRAQDMGPIHMVGWYSLGDADFATVWFTQASGRAFWKDDEYERLFVAARSTVDVAARAAAYHRMMHIMFEQSPCVFLFGLPSIYGRARSLTGWTPPADKVLRLTHAAIT